MSEWGPLEGIWRLAFTGYPIFGYLQIVEVVAAFMNMLNDFIGFPVNFVAL